MSAGTAVKARPHPRNIQPVQISLDVVNKRSLEESLDFYCQGELMEGDNQYFCEEAGRKVLPLPDSSRQISYHIPG